jgi:Hypothetical glycosyl hydrolase family 15
MTDLATLNKAVQADKAANKNVKAWIAAATPLLQPPVPPVTPGGSCIGCATGAHAPALAGFSNLSKYQLVQGQQDDYAVLASVPGEGIGYFAAVDLNDSYNYGVTKAQAVAKGWALKDSAGNYLVNQGYPANYILDVGNPAAQAQWLANARAWLAGNPGVDGIFVDDVYYNITALTGKVPAMYPSQPAWQAAMTSFCQNVLQPLKQQGYYVVANTSAFISGDGRSDTGQLLGIWQAIVGPIVGAVQSEYFVTNPSDDSLRPDGTAYNQNWAGWQGLLAQAQNSGYDLIAVTHDPTPSTYTTAVRHARMLYGKASFLLDWRGGTSTFEFLYDQALADPWDVYWTTNIGTPAAGKVAVGVGWARAFSDGLVLVNPSPSASQTFKLPAGTFTEPDGSTVTGSLSLSATTAMILQG